MIIFKLIYSHLGYENIIFELVVIIYLFDFLINNQGRIQDFVEGGADFFIKSMVFHRYILQYF